MKFFTVELWMGLQESLGATAGDWDAAQAAYDRHRSTIRDRMPPGARAFMDDVSLHDAHLRELEIDVANGTAQMTLHQHTDEGESVHFVRYDGLQSCRSLGDPEKYLPGPGSYGDYGYEEFDLTTEGLVEHRILFSSGIELALAFAELEHTSVRT